MAQLIVCNLDDECAFGESCISDGCTKAQALPYRITKASSGTYPVKTTRSVNPCCSTA